jgi:hypothetical protein
MNSQVDGLISCETARTRKDLQMLLEKCTGTKVYIL